MRKKVLITPRSFGQNSSVPYEMLNEKEYEVIKNPYGRIMTKDEMMEMVSDIDGIILGVDPFSKEVMKQAENLKVISRYGVGLDNVDMEYAAQLNIPVYRTLGANSNAVADYAFALILAVSRKVTLIDRQCRSGNWKKIKTSEVWEKTIGIVGLGSIGRGVAKRANGFNMKILAYDVVKDEEYAKSHNIKYVDLSTIIQECDFISLHLPLIKETKGLFGKKEFKKMKDSAIIINTARGGVIDEDALYEALENNEIGGAGIDVFEHEPPQKKGFLDLDNIVLGSHCAASSFEAIDNMSIMAAENLIKELG